MEVSFLGSTKKFVGLILSGHRLLWGCRIDFSISHRALHDAVDQCSIGADFIQKLRYKNHSFY